MKTALILLFGLVIVALLATAATLVLARFADGPKGPIPGGALASGQLEDPATANWADIFGGKPVTIVELQLENPVSSRTVGAFAHQGDLYLPCDLGFIWRRLPNGATRAFLYTLWLFKDWHEKASADGRVVLRVQGKRYKLNAVRVTDEALMVELRNRVSAAAVETLTLLDVQTNPEDIWFFRLDARPSKAF